MSNILIAHGKRTRRIILAAYVRSAGMEPVIAATCTEALAALDHRPVHLVIAGAATTDDYGVDVVHYIRGREDLRHLPVLLVVDHQAPFVAMANEANAVIYTPLMYRDVMDTVQHCMGMPVY
ncbi:MAG: hypothetical protein AAF787_02660 [Chloroflexota bacterium]